MVAYGAYDRGEFERIAGTITDRTAELLRARVCVTDDHGVVVASSDRALIGLPQERVEPVPTDDPIRVPLQAHGRTGEVIVAAPTGDEETIPPRLAHVLIDLVVNQVAIVDQLPKQHELKNRLILNLLRGTIGDEAAVLREARLLGMDLGPPRAVILIDAADYIERFDSVGSVEERDAEVRRRSQLVVGSIVGFFLLPDDTICAYVGEGEVAVLKASDTKNLVSWVDGEDDPGPPGPSWANLAALKRAARALLARLRVDTGATVNVGIGRYHPGLPGLAHSYQDARAALSLGRRFHGQNRVHCLDGLGIAAFVGVADEATKIDLATHLLSPLDHEPELLRTLDAFFEEDRCPSAAAGRLAIHRNTLAYRLEKIASLTGLDPRRFDDAVQIRLALVLRSLGSGAT